LTSACLHPESLSLFLRERSALLRRAQAPRLCQGTTEGWGSHAHPNWQECRSQCHRFPERGIRLNVILEQEGVLEPKPHMRARLSNTLRVFSLVPFLAVFFRKHALRPLFFFNFKVLFVLVRLPSPLSFLVLLSSPLASPSRSESPRCCPAKVRLSAPGHRCRHSRFLSLFACPCTAVQRFQHDVQVYTKEK
jgi:hypothetical protein